MARLNSSASPSLYSRESSLYRDPTPFSSTRPPGGQPAFAPTISPTPSMSSDKENRTRTNDGDDQERRAKNTMPLPKLPTPPETMEASGRRKRRRLAEQPGSASGPSHSSNELHLDEYDPDQSPEERRDIRIQMRDLQREFHERHDELMRADNTDIVNYIEESSRIMSGVKQTSDAALDSKNFFTFSDFAVKKQSRRLYGDSSLGIDVDEFVSKCITFMRSDGSIGQDEAQNQQAQSTQARRRPRQGLREDDSEDDYDEGDALDWEILGREACFPTNSRPPVPGFLLGPLSVQKRIRTATQRRERLRHNGPTKRPEELEAKDLEKNENANLTVLCSNILGRLKQHLTTAYNQVGDVLDDETTEEQQLQLLKRYRVCLHNNELAVGLFDFALNPYSFGQSVENLFYISFLIRESHVHVDKDEDGLPLLRPKEVETTLEEQRRQGVKKHQAILSLDWPTWRGLLEAFDIKEPLILHREEEEIHVSARGWYG